MILSMQGQMDKMNENLETLIEQIRIANQQRYGRHTEKLDAMDGQLSFFNEAEYFSAEAQEPDLDELLPEKTRTPKKKGKREADLKDFPREAHDHDVSKENWMLYLARATGVKCRLRNISGFVMNLHHGPWRTTKYMFISAQAVTARTSFSVQTVQRIC